ncbi:MAG TPA: hypothetical protein VFZ00_29305 [Solirubrobacter sp.]|jgi:hypothetical protein|nr:hypothetical protein [Solirubrobacter sp.]
MIEELERALRETPLPDEVAARERARQTVAAAHAQQTPRRPATPRLLWVAALALAATAIGVSQRDSGIARDVGHWVRAVVERPAPTPVSGHELPTRGRLLVSEASGLYVVERSGNRRRLGDWQDATWSPRGLFVAATRNTTLAAIDPKNRSVRWRLNRPERVSLPRWAPDGFHIAYRSGRSLRIVYGNGQHDVKAGDDMANVAPAWRPNTARAVAWAATDGTVTVEDALTAKELWTFRARQPRSLAWSADGRRLLIGGRRSYTVHDLSTGERDTTRLEPGITLLAAAYAPTGTRLAVATYAAGQTVIRLGGETVLRAQGRLADLEWSPDGRYLLAGWPSADHWLLVRGDAVSGVRHRFGASARTRGWCC